MTQKNTIAICLFFFFLFLFAFTARGRPQVSDEAAVLGSAVALAVRGHLAIDDLQWLQDQEPIGAYGPDGRLYAKYFPGTIFSAALVYKLAARQPDQPFMWNHQQMAPSAVGAQLALRQNALWGALALTALFLLVTQLYSVRTAVVTVLLIGLCSDWWYQSRGFLSEVGVGAFTILSLYFAVAARPYLSGLTFAISLLFRPFNAIAIPIWLYAVWRGGYKTIWSGIPILFSLLLLAAYNHTRFGSPLNFGYGSEGFSASFLTGLYGILFSPGRSLFLYSPILLLALWGALLLWRQDRPLALACLLTILNYLLLIALWHRWDGGWTWGSRLLTPIIPLTGVLLAAAIEQIWRKPALMALVLFLAVLGLGVQLLALSRDPLRVLLEEVSGGRIPEAETLFTLHHSWLALQWRALQNWQPCDVDASALRLLFANCQ